MDRENRPEDDDPGTKGSDEVTGYAIDPIGPPIVPGPEPVPPCIQPPGKPAPDPVEFGLSSGRSSSDSTGSTVDFLGGPSGESDTQGYLMEVPVPPAVDDGWSKKNQSSDWTPGVPDPYEELPNDPTSPQAPERMPAGNDESVIGHMIPTSVLPPTMPPGIEPDPEKKSNLALASDEPTSPTPTPPRMPPGTLPPDGTTEKEG
jgi:hypothetical protein